MHSFKTRLALAGVVQWIEWWPMDWKVAGSIPVQGTSWVAGQVTGGGL